MRCLLVHNASYPKLSDFPAASSRIGINLQAADTKKVYVSNGTAWLELGASGDAIIPYDMGFYAPTAENPTEILGAYLATRAISLHPGVPGSRALCRTAPTGNITLGIFRNEVQIGTVVFQGAVKIGTISFTTGVKVVAGDVISLRTLASGEPAIKDVTVTTACGSRI